MTTYHYDHLVDPQEASRELQLYACGSECCRPNQDWGPGDMRQYVVHYVHCGKGSLRLGEEEYDVMQGHCFLQTPDSTVEYMADAQDPWFYSWVAINGSRVEHILQRAGFNPQSPVLSLRSSGAVQRSLAQLMEASRAHLNRDLRLLSTMYDFLSTLVDEARTKKADRRLFPVQGGHVGKALRYIEVNYIRAISITEMAETIGLDRKYLSKLFKNETGLSPQEYLLKFRIDKACQLMRSTGMSIGQVSIAVGYRDQLAFSKMFKKQLGESPSDYRKRETDKESS